MSENNQSIVIKGGSNFTISKDNVSHPDPDPVNPDPDKPDPVEPVDPVDPGTYPSGNSSEPTTYPIRAVPSTNGTVTVSPKNAPKGATVTVTVTPDEGYELDGLTVIDSQKNEIELTSKGGGTYTFTMPGRTVTVTAICALPPKKTDEFCDGGADCPSLGFTDVSGAEIWYHEAVDYMLRTGLINGYSSSLFGPDDKLSRAQFAQILYNRAGNPAVTGGSGFTDVAPGQWYTPAVTWAAANGIAAGYGDGKFGPDDMITREQLATMLWRYMGRPRRCGTEASLC